MHVLCICMYMCALRPHDQPPLQLTHAPHPCAALPYRMLSVNMQLLAQKGVDFSVEWFTEPAGSLQEAEELARVRSEVPNLTLLTDSDLLWTWHQMWSADIFIMSKSGYSFVPAVINARGLIVHAPPLGIRKCKIACSPSHWHEPLDQMGALGPNLEAVILDRVREPIFAALPPPQPARRR